MNTFKPGNIVAIGTDNLCMIVEVFDNWLLIQPINQTPEFKTPEFNIWKEEAWPLLDFMP